MLLFAALASLALGITIWAKSRRMLAENRPYIFGFWDGGLLLKGEEWEPRHSIWIGRTLVSLAILAAAFPALAAGEEFLARARREARGAGPCEKVLTAGELRAAGIQSIDKAVGKSAYRGSCSYSAYPNGFTLSMSHRSKQELIDSAGQFGRVLGVKPIAAVPGATLFDTSGSRTLLIEKGEVTLQVVVGWEIDREALEKLAREAAARPEQFSALDSLPLY